MFRVGGTNVRSRRAHTLTDLVSLVRYNVGADSVASCARSAGSSPVVYGMPKPPARPISGSVTRSS